MAEDHPESDLSDFCNQDQIKQYQTIVRQLIWLSGLERFDNAVHVMTMSRFRQQPRIGHLERLKKIIGYLASFPHGSIRFRLHEPEYSNLPQKEYDWQRTVYASSKEEIPHGIPEPKGKHVPPHSTITKRHNILAFHRVREAIAAKLMAFYRIQSAYNLSDMLSKHWDHPTVYPMILKLLITRGNATLIPREATQEKEKEILNPQPEKLKTNKKDNKNMK